MNKTRLNQFFNLYEKRTNAGIAGETVSIAEIMACFANNFIESGPKGVITGKNNDDFRKKIPKGFKFYRKIGISKMIITDREYATIDKLHYLAKISWKSVYKTKGGKKGEIDFVVNYLITTTDDQYKIFAYITGDEEGELKKHGLVGE